MSSSVVRPFLNRLAIRWPSGWLYGLAHGRWPHALWRKRSLAAMAQNIAVARCEKSSCGYEWTPCDACTKQATEIYKALRKAQALRAYEIKNKIKRDYEKS